MARLFIAVWPAPLAVAALEALPRTPRPGTRFTAAPQWHATLRFLGDLDTDAAAEALAGVDFAPTTAVVGPVVERLAPGVLVAPVGGLDAIAEQVAAATASLGPPADHPFRGHITLARQKADAPCSLDGAPVDASFPVDEIALVRSVRHAEGARYVTVTTRQAAS